MIEVIRIWLNGKREYYPGLAIALQFHANTAILQVMKAGDNTRNKERLLTIMQDELARLKSLQENTAVIIPKQKAPIRPVVSYRPAPADQPEVSTAHLQSPVYIAAKQEADMAYKQLMAVRAVLFNQANVEHWEDPNTPDRVQQRSKTALQVVIGYREVTRLYEKADYILLNGAPMATEETHEEEYQAVPDALVFKALKNLRSAYSKLKQKAPTADRLALMEKHMANILKLEAQCRTLS